MVDITKPYLKNVIIKEMEYNDYNNYEAIFITIMVSLLVFFFSTGILFYDKLIEYPIWIVIALLVFICFEIIFFFLLFYFNKQKKDKKTEIQKL